MGQSIERCAVCEDHEAGDAEGGVLAEPRKKPEMMARVVIQGRALSLCRAHAATVAVAMPRTFEDMRALFVGLTRHGQEGGGQVAIERRSPIPRRNAEDRRVFPPRLEGRRMGGGRRATDPQD
jgi:hypothetical protein